MSKVYRDVASAAVIPFLIFIQEQVVEIPTGSRIVEGVACS
jgi:hypothetical protein